MDASVQSLVGIGLYTVPEAQRLTGAPARSIRRWLLGYTRSAARDAAVHNMPPIWQGDIGFVDGIAGLSFLDLMEVRFVYAFRRHHVPWRVIRLAARRACDLTQRGHPFATQKFKTDGRRIFAEIVERTGETRLLDLARNQYAFHQMISPSLYEGLEFSNRDEVIRWYPRPRSRLILVDPKRSFGRPIVAREGVPTEILAKAVAVEGSAEAVAKWYNASLRSVRAAVEFERELNG